MGGTVRTVSAEEAIALIPDGSNVFIHTGAAAPSRLLSAFREAAHRYSDITFYHLHTEGEAFYTEPEFADRFRAFCFFVGANTRNAVNRGNADYIPCFLSEIPSLFRRGTINIDVALIHVSPPDEHGFCSLGVSVDIAPSVLQTANCIIAQVNPQMPRVHGDGFIHVSRIAAMVDCNDPIPVINTEEADEDDHRIATHVASLVEDGATLQMGIGKIPNAVLEKLINHKDLGIHSEMFSQGILPLVERGVITNKHKVKHRGKIIGGFVIGDRSLYDYIDDNPFVELRDIGYVNDVHVIRQNPKVTAINSALEVDLTGQICADSIGHSIYSGVGGQMDFIRGATQSEDGKPIIALRSTMASGRSKIVFSLTEGAGVVTTRAHAHFIVTEYGVADLYGKSLKQRIHALIAIAHPNHREGLERQVREMMGRKAVGL